MALKTRKKSLQGGKYIGEGTYGCGYSPAIRCKGQAVRPPGMFSKVMNMKYALEEQAIGKWFQKVDPLQKYFIYPKKYCVLHGDMLEMPENNMKPCKKEKYTTYNIKNARMLQYINGGKALYKLSLAPDEYIAFFQSLSQLLEGLKLLHSKNIAHMDIKQENVVFLKESAAKYNIRYIDFGLSINIEDLETNPIDDRVYKNNYFAWPYDTRFMRSEFSKNDITEISIIKFINKHRINSNNTFPFELYYIDNKDIHVKEDTYTKIWDDIATRAGTDFNTWKEIISKSTDVYSLARLISEVYAKFSGHYYKYGDTYVFDEQRTNEMTLSSMKSLVTPGVWGWHKKVNEEITIPLNKLILKMMNINPLQRITAADALDEYNLLLEKFQIFFKPNLLTKALDITPGLGARPIYSTSALGPGTGPGAVTATAAATATGPGPGAGAVAGPVVAAPLVAMPRINEDPFPHEKLRVLRALEKKLNRGEELTDAEEAELEIAKLLINEWEEAYNQHRSGGGPRRQRTRKVKKSRK